MVGTLQPLGKQYPVVNPDGTPTEYFIRWAQQKQIDIGAGVAASEVPAIIAAYLTDHQLQAGTGITLTPTGNLVDSPTIAADLQALLDGLSTTQGSVLYRNATDWVSLAPGTSGQFLKTQGAGADPVWATSGGGSSGLTPPVLTDFPTAINVGAETTLADTSSGMVVAVGTGGAGTALRGRLKTVSGNFTAIFKIKAVTEGLATDSVAITLRDSASGRMITFGIKVNAAPGAFMFERWTNSTTFSATSKATTSIMMDPWFKIQNDGTSIITSIGISKTGPWLPYHTETKAAFLTTIDQIGFVVEDQALNNYLLLVEHYEQA